MIIYPNVEPSSNNPENFHSRSDTMFNNIWSLYFNGDVDNENCNQC